MRLPSSHKRQQPKSSRRLVFFRPRLELLEDRCLLSYTINEFPLPAPNSLPNHIVGGPDGNIWFMETNRDVLGRISPAGQITEIPLPVPAGNATFVFGPDGNIWLALQTDIAEITPLGVLLHDYAIPSASPPGIPDAGLNITIGPDGNIWYTEPYTNNLVGRLTPGGQINEFPLPDQFFGTPVPGNSFGAAEIITGPDGNLWFGAVANSNNYIGRISTSGNLAFFAIPDGSPRGLTSGPDGSLWMTAATNGYSNDILRVNIQGQLTGQFSIPTANSDAYGMTVGSDGALWFTESNVNQIGRINTDGTITEIPINTGNHISAGIATGPDGNIWFSEYSSNNIGELVLHPHVHWINPAGGDWDTASNWRDDQGVNRVPGANDQAIIDIPGQNTFTVTHSSSAADTIYSLTSQDALILSGGSLSLAADSTINNNLTLATATLQGTGNITVTGLFTWSTGFSSTYLTGPSGSFLKAQGGMTLTGYVYGLYLYGRTLINATGQTATMSGPANNSTASSLDVTHGATFENDGELDLAYQTNIYTDSSNGPGTLTNNGRIVQSTGAGGIFATTTTNNGSISVQTGTFAFANGTSSMLNAGTITAASGTELDINGSFTQTAAGSLTADRVVIFILGYNYGTATFTGSYSANVTSVSSDHITTAIFSGDATHGGTPHVGALSIINASVDFSPAVPETLTLPNLDIEQGTLGGSDNFIVTGLFTWSTGYFPSTLSGPTGSFLKAEGGISMTGYGYGLYLDGRTLVNAAGQTAAMSGPANNNGASSMDIVNGAAFENDGELDLAYQIYIHSDTSNGPGSFTNNGRIVQSTGAGGIFATTTTNNSSISVQTGTFAFANGTSSMLNAGTITAASGTELDINGSFIQTAAGSLTADRVVIFILGYNYGTATFAGSYSANVTSVSSDHITTAVFSGDATHGGTPHVGALSISNATVDFSPLVPETVTLANLVASNGTLTGTNSFVVTGPFTWSGGTLTGPVGSKLTAQAGVNINAVDTIQGRTLVNAGAANWSAGTVSFFGTASFTNTATGTFNDQIDGTFGSADGCCQEFNNQGTFIKSASTGTTYLQMQLNNSGTVNIEQGVLNLGCGYVQGSGGSISGSVSGSVSNPGTYNSAPSSNPPVLTSYTQTVTGTLYEQIGGLIAGQEYGQIIVNGNVNLAGNLQVVLINGFTPQAGNQFTIINNEGTSPINGTFANLPEGGIFTANGYQFQISYQGGDGNDVVLTVTKAATNTALTASVNPSLLNQPVTFTATVSAVPIGAPTPAGTIQFQIDGVNSGSPMPLSGGKASLSTSTLAPSSHTITAIYSGDNLSLGSTGTLTENVLYNFSGFLAPLNQNMAFGINRTISIKFQLSDFNGVFISNLAAVSSLQVSGPSGTISLTGSLRYDTSANQYVANWSTKGLQAGSYTITLALADSTVKTVTLQLTTNGKGGATQMAAGSDGGDNAGLPDTVLSGDLLVYINDPNGYFTADQLARIQDTINGLDVLLAPYGITITEVTDSTSANLVLDNGTTSACGGMAQGVLGCFNPAGEITLLQGWNWYAGADPTLIAPGQYDFQSTVTHEFGHALGLGGDPDPNSPMYETLAAGQIHRTFTLQDLNFPDAPAGPDPERAAPASWATVYFLDPDLAAGQSPTINNHQAEAAAQPVAPSAVLADWMAISGFGSRSAQALDGGPFDNLWNRPALAIDSPDDFWSSIAANTVLQEVLGQADI